MGNYTKPPSCLEYAFRAWPYLTVHDTIVNSILIAVRKLGFHNGAFAHQFTYAKKHTLVIVLEFLIASNVLSHTEKAVFEYLRIKFIRFCEIFDFRYRNRASEVSLPEDTGSIFADLLFAHNRTLELFLDEHREYVP